MEPHLLVERLEAIGQALEQTGHALALIGLGSVGLERERLDAYSDLDFFAIVETGYKRVYLDGLQWLSEPCPIVYCFANTQDGYKALYADGIFCEFAVFELHELASIPFKPGRIIWKQPYISDMIAQPVIVPDSRERHSQDWLLGEALTNLLVGLGRERRGEHLSAERFIQGYAVDRLIELASMTEVGQAAPGDPFDSARRFEQRYPKLARHLPACMQGYTRNRESALTVLALLEQHFSINPEIAAAIRALCDI